MQSQLRLLFVLFLTCSCSTARSQAAPAPAPQAQASPTSKASVPVASDPDTAGQLHLHLRCDALQTKRQSKAIKSDAFGFGSPTAPEDDETTQKTSRSVYVVLDGATGSIQLSREFAATWNSGHPDGIWPLRKLKVTAGDVTAEFDARNPGPQTIRINRISGEAEMRNYGPLPLHATCHVQKIQQAF